VRDRGTILIIDDEADVSRYLAAALEDAGYRTLTASDAESGLDLVRRETPDLVCLDLVMPARSGVSLFAEMKDLPVLAGIPIVVVTGVSPADAEEMLGADPPEGFVEKPVDVPRLIETVNGLLGRKEGSR